MVKRPKRENAAEHPDAVFGRIVSILEQARGNVVHAVNTNMVLAYWLIGREIVQQVQGGEERAAYGEKVVEDLSSRLTERYGKGFSVTNLWYFKQFYLAFQSRFQILHPVGGESSELSISHPAGGEFRLASITHPVTVHGVWRIAPPPFYAVEQPFFECGGHASAFLPAGHACGIAGAWPRRSKAAAWPRALNRKPARNSGLGESADIPEWHQGRKRHQKIYAKNELPESATANEFLAVETEGKRQVQRSILHYNLDAIIAAGKAGRGLRDSA